jgi:hypothetical protein
MKKNLLKVVLVLSIVGAAWACSKDSTCWSCVEQNGNTFVEVCKGSDMQNLKDQGYTCTEK